MWISDEEAYFSDVEVVGVCPICKEEITRGQEIYYDSNTDTMLCSRDCARKFIGLTEVNDVHYFGYCENCGKEITEEFEAVRADGQFYCDDGCAFESMLIKEMEAYIKE